MKTTPDSGLCWWIKWFSTLMIIIGGLLAASGNGLPWNFLIGSIGCVGWICVAAMWKDRSMMVLNSVMFTLSILSFLNN